MRQLKQISKLEKNYHILLGTLIEISLGQGEYDPDGYTHARNTINNMKKLAKEAIAEVKQNVA